jgi:60 kDa SS-A/Ro ribonucleoprotein
MSRFSNSSSLSSARRSVKANTVNQAGAPAHSLSAKAELVTFLTTSFMKHEPSEKARLQGLVSQVDPIFAAKAAVMARKEYGLRSVSHVVAAEIAKNVKGQTWTQDFISNVIRRPDDVLEILGFYIQEHGRKGIPNSLKKGLGRALTRFSEYQLAKYSKDKSALKLVDAVNLLHPKATPALNALMQGKLESAETWEVLLSAAGSDSASKAQVWSTLVCEDKLGYLALVRNLRNILEQADEATIEIALHCVASTDEVRRSNVMPFQFRTAWKVMDSVSSPYAGKAKSALSKALDASVQNIPSFEARSVVLLDVSGSMRSNNVDDIAGVFAAALIKRWNADLVTFDGSARYVPVDSSQSVLGIAESIPYTGGSTNLNCAFRALKERAYARIVILSDMQNWVADQTADADLRQYESAALAHPWVYSFDLTGSGTLQVRPDRVRLVSGCSDAVFKLFDRLETDPNALISQVENVQFPKATDSAN